MDRAPDAQHHVQHAQVAPEQGSLTGRSLPPQHCVLAACAQHDQLEARAPEALKEIHKRAGGKSQGGFNGVHGFQHCCNLSSHCRSFPFYLYQRGHIRTNNKINNKVEFIHLTPMLAEPTAVP